MRAYGGAEMIRRWVGVLAWWRGGPEGPGAEAFWRVMTYENVRRLKVLSWLGILITAVLAAVFLRSPAGLGQDLEWVFFGLRLAWIGLCVAFLALAGAPAGPHGVGPRQRLAVAFLTGLMVMLAAFWSGFSQQFVDVITYYLVVTFLMATAVYLPPLTALLVFGLGVLVLEAAVTHYQADPTVRLFHRYNGLVLTILAYAVNQVNYVARSQRFLADRVIARQRRELERQSMVDGLTGLANRRMLDQRLEEEWRRMPRGSSPLSMIMIDIDLFKDFNDAHGHLAGDDCLVAVAAEIRRSLRRAGDLAARFGGEEFTLLLPETDAAGALKLAEDIRRRVWDLDIEHPATPSGRLTLSMGVVSTFCPPGRAPRDLLMAADQAMYASKEAGRDRLTVVEDWDGRSMPQMLQ